MKRLILTLCAASLAACASMPTDATDPSAQTWIESWSASPLPPSVDGGFFGPSPSWQDATIRQVVRLSAGGSVLRVRLTNEYGAAPLVIGAATIAPAAADGAPIGDPIRLTFSGAASATAPAGAPLVSDPVALPVDALASVSISVYFPQDTGPCTCHLTGVQTAYVSAPGDHTAEAAFEPASTLAQRAFLGGVDVLAAGEAKTIVTLGDSITDGVGATTDGNDRWPDQLAERLAARGGATTYGIANQGISGNRLLSGGAGGFGESILTRFDRDVLGVPGATHMILFIGVNDLGLAFGSGPIPGLEQADVSAQTMIAGYRQVIARAHLHGIHIVGATIAPYGGATYWSKEGEAVRQAINTWIRESGEFDGVADFDAAVRDPDDPARMADGLHMGDFLHGSPAGYAAMAAAVDLSLFD